MIDNTFRECDTCSAKPGSPVLCAGCLHNREVIERLTPKVAVVDDRFFTFYEAYPLKKSKAPAQKAWKRLKPSETLFKKIMEALETQKKTRQWQDKNYIPHPSTWLNQERWEDEVDTPNTLPTDDKYKGI